MLIREQDYEEEWLSIVFDENDCIKYLKESILCMMRPAYSKQSLSRIEPSVYTVALSLARMVYINYPLRTLFKAGIGGGYASHRNIVNGRDTSMKIGAKGINNTLQCLLNYGMVDVYVCEGNFDRYADGTSRYSHFSMTDKGVTFVKLVLGEFISNRYLQRKESSVVITEKTVQLRGDKLALLEFKMTKEVKDMIRVVENYNSLMVDVEVKDHNGTILQPLQACRIFCQGTFERGGRVYYSGKSPQQMSQEDRLKLTINGESVSELDFKAIHMAIIDLYGGRPWSRPDRDPYYLLNYSWILFYEDWAESVGKEHVSKVLRGIIKKAFMVALNAESEVVARYVIKEFVENDTSGLMDGVEAFCIDGLIAELKNYHPDFEASLFSGIGTRLQRIDSDIAEKVLISCTDAKIPVICIHDSFIVQSRYSELLEGFMRDAWIKVLGSDDNCGISHK